MGVNVVQLSAVRHITITTIAGGGEVGGGFRGALGAGVEPYYHLLFQHFKTALRTTRPIKWISCKK